MLIEVLQFGAGFIRCIDPIWTYYYFPTLSVKFDPTCCSPKRMTSGRISQCQAVFYVLLDMGVSWDKLYEFFCRDKLDMIFLLSLSQNKASEIPKLKDVIVSKLIEKILLIGRDNLGDMQQGDSAVLMNTPVQSSASRER